MTSDAVYNIILIAWLVLSPLIFTSLFFIVAPYGRHIKSGWGPAHASTDDVDKNAV